MSYLDEFFFLLYPYVAGTVFLLGSLLRYERGQYTWSSDSSQLLCHRYLRWGSNLFHVGVLLLFLGHLVLLIPQSWLSALQLTPPRHQILSMVCGLLFAAACLTGLLLLLYRRLTDPRIWATTRTMDVVVLVWIGLALSLGIWTTYYSSQELSGSRLETLMHWAQHIATFRGDAAQFLTDVPWVYKVHMVVGMTLFALIPFSRLVHIWSGFASIAYLIRPYQIMRPRSPSMRPRASVREP